MKLPFSIRAFFIIAASFAMIIVLPFIGQTVISFTDIWDKASDNYFIFWDLRVPRVLFAALIGAILAAGGLVFQSIFRNDLATPYTLGIASGASLGTLIAIQFGITGVFVFIPYSVFTAFCGAFLSVVLIHGLTRAKKNMGLQTVLLAGVSVNFLFSALILFLQYLMNHADLMSAVRWMMGGIDIFGYTPILMLTPFLMLILVILYIYRRHLDILSLGDELAQGRGVDIIRTRQILFFTVSAVIAAVVSFAGPIGFVGLIIPHAMKMLIGRTHAKLIPYVMTAGGAFLALADTFARTIIAPAEIPVGVITSMLGVPFFLYLLMKKK